jgi:hypothetical protein
MKEAEAFRNGCTFCCRRFSGPADAHPGAPAGRAGYDAPRGWQPLAIPPLHGRPAMKLKAAFRFPFLGEQRWSNLGLVLVCFLIPIVGPIVVVGYGSLVEARLIEDIHAEPPLFDFGRFSDYLRRGVAPFVAGLIMIPVFMIGMAPAMMLFLIGIVMGQQSTLAMVLLLAAGIAWYFLVFPVGMALMAPITLKAMVGQNIGGAFEWQFISDYLRRVGLVVIGYTLLMFLLAMLAAPLCLCIPFAGTYMWITLYTFINWHLQTQFYLLYRERGGAPLAVAPDAGPIVHSPPATPG